MKNKKACIVFGANGYIGRHLTYFLKNNHFVVEAVDMQKEFESFEIDYLNLDILNIENLKKIDWNVDYVFMFAGISGTYSGFDDYDKFVNVNEIGLLNILNEIRKSNYRPHIVYPSSRLVYKGSEIPLKEDDPKESKTIYAINKNTCENILDVYRNSFDIEYSIYRICVPYGNNFGADYSFGTIGNFLNQAKGKGTINLFGDGSLRRTFTHIEDICAQIIQSCSNKITSNQIYNTIGEEFSLKEIALLIANKYNVKLTFSEWPDKDLRIESGHTVFNAQKIKNDFNLELKYSFENWLAQI